LDELKASSGGAPVTVARDDLLRFPCHLSERPELVLCMGDTLTHLDEHAAVTSLIAEVARSVAPGSRFVLTFRDDPGVPAGTVRRIPVRSDGSRRLVCTLEYAEASVCVHDKLHELIDGAWRTRSSTYRKLRLASNWVAQQLEQHGFGVDLGAWPHGMVRLDAVLA
jgi:hypothetical protein